MSYLNVTQTSAIEDQIIARSPDKQRAIKDDDLFSFFQQHIQTSSEGTETPCDMHTLLSSAIDVLDHSSAKTNNLVLYTTDRRHEAESFVLDNPEYDLIQTTPMGYFLEQLRLFESRSWGTLGMEGGYTLWNMASAKLIQETQSTDITMFANLNNLTSSLWMVELALVPHNIHPQNFHLLDSAQSDYFQTLSRADISHYSNALLTEWGELLDAHIADPDCPRRYDAMAQHPVGLKYVQKTSLNTDDLLWLRTMHAEFLSGLRLRPQHNAPVMEQSLSF